MALRPAVHRPRQAQGPAVTIVCGPPGAGKSTYVRTHARAGDLVVDVDELYRALTGLYGREKPAAIRPFVLAAREALLSRLERAPDLRAAWIITCGENLALRQDWRRRLGAVVVVIPTPAAVCLERMRAQGRPAAHIDEMAEVCARWHRDFALAPGETVLD